jgi:hypothetical protein
LLDEGRRIEALSISDWHSLMKRGMAKGDVPAVLSTLLDQFKKR